MAKATKKKSKQPVSRLIGGIVLVALILFGVSGYAWWQKVYSDPEKAFWSMLDNSLTTASVTKHVMQNAQDGGLDQITILNLQGQGTAQAVTKLTQPGSSGGTDAVVTESIGTKDADYVRYTSIKTSQTGKNGQSLDFSGVLNIWGKSSGSADGQASGAQFLKGTIFGVVPFAPLNSAQRSSVLSTMAHSNMYSVDYSKATTKVQNGRKVFVYQVSVNAQGYVATLKQFAHELGIKDLDNLDPQTYASAPAQQMEFSIDKISRQLTNITYSGGARQEAYSGYGIRIALSVPSKTVDIADLQNRLQTLQ